MWKERKKKKEGRRRRNNAKFSVHYVRPVTHNVYAHALRSHQFFVKIETDNTKAT